MTTPVFPQINPATGELTEGTARWYVKQSQFGQPNGVAALNSAGQPVDSTGAAVPTAAALNAIDTAALKGVAGTKLRRDYFLVGTTWPPRPATTDGLRFLPWPDGQPELMVPGLVPATNGSRTGGGGMVLGLDSCFLTQSPTAP